MTMESDKKKCVGIPVTRGPKFSSTVTSVSSSQSTKVSIKTTTSTVSHYLVN